MQQHNVTYCLLFATAVCVVCAVLVSASAVGLRERQEANVAQEKKRNVLLAAGLAKDNESLSREEVDARFSPVRQVVVELATGEEVKDVDLESFDQQKLAKNPETSREVPDNRARVRRTPNQALVYQLMDEEGELSMLIIPVEGHRVDPVSCLSSFPLQTRSTRTVQRSRSTSTSRKRPRAPSAIFSSVVVTISMARCFSVRRA